MSLYRLGLCNLRGFSSVEIEPSQSLNLLLGSNAAGKTTILEAIHLLSSARSFRSTHLGDLVRHGEQMFQVTASVSAPADRMIHLGIEKSRSGLTLKAAGRKLNRVSELAAWLPTQVIHPDSHHLVNGGPKQRRRFLDWGLFHVEQFFFPAWQRYDKALKQRNATLKLRSTPNLERAWDPELSTMAEKIHELRKAYLSEYLKVLPFFAKGLVGEHDFQVDYEPGWDVERPLADVLLETLPRDKQKGFTCSGPHRADLVFRLDGRRIQHYVSRGQEKMLVAALILAQVELFTRRSGRRCVVLLDDFAAELDSAHQQRLLELLRPMGAQLFLTMVSRGSLKLDQWPDMKTFHVEHGAITEVV
ncbi:MAG TPA: DNA replication/repair protein RecF [Gammaproteobacteria bacterium]